MPGSKPAASIERIASTKRLIWIWKSSVSKLSAVAKWVKQPLSSTVSLAQLEKTLDGHGFFRVHRGYLVNLALVKEVEPQSGGTLLLTLDGVDEKIPVSRRRVSSLKKALGL